MKRSGLLISIVMVASLLISCTSPTPEVVEKVVTQVVTQVVKETVVQVETVKETVIVEGTPQTVEKEVTKVVEVEKIVTATPEPERGPAVGGTMVIAANWETLTLDPHVSDSSDGPILDSGATLVVQAADGSMVPYLAESWEISEDGLTWDFKLKENVKFHDGTPLTAQEYAWTINRALDPATQSPAAAQLLGTVTSAEALDDYTLRLNLAEPYFALLYSLSLSFLQPLSPEAVEAAGDQYGRNPVGVGPYKFKEWATGEKIVLERNPDFDWGPSFLVNAGPSYIETIEYRFIPESATILAGLEAGDIDVAFIEDPRSAARIRESGQFIFFEQQSRGMDPGITVNTSKPPFDDARVRQAFSLAVDREALVNVILGGAGVPQYGPISESVFGYWPGVEYVGYKFNLPKAKSLMEEAGYTYNDEGMLEKDGEPFVLELMGSAEWTDPRVSEVLQQQFKALGVEIEIVTLEYGIAIGTFMGDDYQIGMIGYGYGDVDILHIVFHSSNIGAFNLWKVNDPELDSYLDRLRTETDPDRRQAAANDAQRRIVEQAYGIPLYAGTDYTVVSDRIQGDVMILPDAVFLNDAYIETE